RHDPRARLPRHRDEPVRDAQQQHQRAAVHGHLGEPPAVPARAPHSARPRNGRSWIFRASTASWCIEHGHTAPGLPVPGTVQARQRPHPFAAGVWSSRRRRYTSGMTARISASAIHGAGSVGCDTGPLLRGSRPGRGVRSTCPGRLTSGRSADVLLDQADDAVAHHLPVLAQLVHGEVLAHPGGDPGGQLDL
ncbi:hypothetical protein KXW38_009879, partial [Aspergillus fumigatus]